MVDNVIVLVQGGNGGNGAVAFHREKYAPRGGPDGGDGGKGGDIMIKADCNIDDLSRFKSKRTFHAEAGQPGGKNKKSGRNGADLVITVPVGTLVRDVRKDDGVLLADLSRHGDGVVAAEGGRGGWGNMHFATPSRQMPMEARPGAPGEEKRLELELRLMADVTLVGPPNSGKSMLLTMVSRAPAVVAEYPFTTREPVLGTVDLGRRTAVVVELPGIILGASEGRGLGNRFLRHALRSGALVYVLGGDSEDPVADYAMVRDEVCRYDPGLEEKPQMAAVNKVDLPEVRERMETLKRKFQKLGVQVRFISAKTGEGVRELIERAVQEVPTCRDELGSQTADECPVVVFRPKPKARKTAGPLMGDDVRSEGSQ